MKACALAPRTRATKVAVLLAHSDYCMQASIRHKNIGKRWALRRDALWKPRAGVKERNVAEIDERGGWQVKAVPLHIQVAQVAERRDVRRDRPVHPIRRNVQVRKLIKERNTIREHSCHNSRRASTKVRQRPPPHARTRATVGMNVQRRRATILRPGTLNPVPCAQRGRAVPPTAVHPEIPARGRVDVEQGTSVVAVAGGHQGKPRRRHNGTDNASRAKPPRPHSAASPARAEIRSNTNTGRATRLTVASPNRRSNHVQETGGNPFPNDTGSVT